MILNHNRLHYFWVTANEGSIVAASRKLHITSQTISTQIKLLEEELDTALFRRAGRSLRLTEAGETTRAYAESIFSLGMELQATLRGESSRELRVGISDALPKLLCHQMLEPALKMKADIRLVCREDGIQQLLAELALHRLDLVLNDSPIPNDISIRAYNHPLGKCGVVWAGAPALVGAYRDGFPASLNGAPFLLPTADTALRRSIDRWLDDNGIQPRIIAEIADSALLKAFGERGEGVFPVASVVLDEVVSHYHVRPLGVAEGVTEHFYAISIERRIRHPAVVEICRQAILTLENSAPIILRR